MSDEQKQTILVTGAAGFIGAHLVRNLLETPADVHILARPGGSLWRLQDRLSRLAVHRVDFADLAQVTRAVQAIAPHAIIHLAAHGASTRQADEAQMLTTNVIGTFHMLRAAAEVEHLIHVGGSSEYGAKDVAMREDMRLDPRTFYGASKACATLLVRQYAQATQKAVTILRPFSVYGPLESEHRFIPTAVRAALTGKPLLLTPPGIARDFIFVEDVVDACRLSLKTPLCGEILNIGTGVQHTNEDVVAVIEELTGKKIDVRPGAYAPHASDTSSWVADIAKARALLGWQPRFSLRAGLEKVICSVS